MDKTMHADTPYKYMHRLRVGIMIKINPSSLNRFKQSPVFKRDNWVSVEERLNWTMSVHQRHFKQILRGEHSGKVFQWRCVKDFLSLGEKKQADFDTGRVKVSGTYDWTGLKLQHMHLFTQYVCEHSVLSLYTQNTYQTMTSPWYHLNYCNNMSYNISPPAVFCLPPGFLHTLLCAT